ncbi:mediator of DNA damage checkpoint protein 1 isoform X3 [Chionomys nivalis]|uniref:mediator of DNA damage checkpoint protein 1 isoform X3 n=1 Tax=Chionomys nivalis TaxID=269649 RepID=UPI00259225BC|nr:mediator of DNA damage checkpoint protein 1 isoform X3 [Chionomys nivalis]
MENTQVIDWDAEEEETEISDGSLGHSLEPIGRLRLFSSAHGPERDFPLYLGKNVVGRSPDCSVTLPFPSISKQHAVIEISAYNKAPILQDCGSLNGTQLVKPPKVLTPGVSHRLKDQELILFADFPCQYRRLDVPPPLVSRGFLTIEGTPRTQGESQTSRVLLAEDSEEEVDFPSGRCVINGSRNPTSPSATVVPESDEEASSPAPRAPGLSLPFDVGSDTDEEQGQQPAVGGSSSARAGAAAVEAEQPGVKGMTAGIQLGQAQPTEPKFKDAKVKSEAGNGAAQVGSVLERNLTLGEDSDTDVEGEEGVPMTPCVGPGKKKQVLLGVGPGDPGAPGVGHVQGSPASAVEEGRAPVAVPSETNHTPMVIDSDTDEEGEVSAALTLAHLKERGITLWSRDSGMEEVKSQPQVLVERSQSASGRDSDTDVEEGKREMVPDSPMDIDEALTVRHSESQPPHRARDGGEDVDMNSPGGHLEGNQASSATVDNNATQVEEEVPPEPAVTLGEKHQLPLEEAQPSEEAWEAAVGEGSSSAVADVRKSQQPVAEDARTECTTAVSEAESTLVGAQRRSPTAPVEQVVVYTGTRGDPTQPQREGAQTPTGREKGAQMGRTKNAKDCSDESDDLCLPATQCFVERESQSSEAQSLEDEPTQGFPWTLPQEPGPSHLSLQTPGAGALDVPWEVLATQPFCLREPEASEPQLIATHLEAHGSPPSLPSAPPGHQHLVHTELSGVQGREIQTMEKAMGRLSCKMTSAGKASGGDPEPPAHCLLSPVPEASALPQSLLASQSRKQSLHPPLTSSPSEPHLPESLHTEPHVRPRRSSRMTPSSSAALKPYTACPTNLPAAPRPTSQVTRGRANKSSARTPEVIVPTDSELQPPTSTEQPAIPRPTSQVTQGSTDSSFDKTPESVLTGPKIQPPTTERPVTPNPTPRATRGRPSRSSIKTPELNVPTSSELQPPTSTEQAVIPKPTSRATRSRARKSPIRTPEPVVPTVSEIQPPTSTEQAVIPKPTSRATRGRPRKSIRTPEPVVPTGPELQPVISTEEPVTPNLTSQSSQGTSRKSIRTPVVPTGPEFQPAISTEQPVTPELSSQGRARRSSVRTPEASISAAPELQPFTSRKPPAPKPTALGTRGRTCKPSIEESKSVEPVAPNFEPPISTDHLVTPEVTDQSITLKSSPLSASPVSTTPELEPGPPEPVPQGSRRRRRKAAGKQGSHIVPIDHEPYSAPSKPESQSLTNQSSGTLEEAELIAVAPEAAIAQVPETPPHIPLMQKEAAGRSGLTPKSQPEASRVHKELSTTTDSPLQKRPRRQVPQMTIVPKEEDPPETPVKEEPQERAIPVPGKRKRGRAEDETQGNPSRSRRAKPNQEAVAPKVLFTGVVDSRGERAVLALGGSLASSVNEASHLVTDRIRRTVKFLCALGKGIPILSLNWLYQSRKAGHFLPPDDYLVTDPEQEKNFSFSLRDALSRARERKLLEGYEIHVTPRVQPPPAQMAEIIGCCGGTVLPSMPHSYKPQRVVVTCTEDLPCCAVPTRLGLPLLSSEFLLTGVLKQEATPEAFVLSNLEMLSS